MQTKAIRLCGPLSGDWEYPVSEPEFAALANSPRIVLTAVEDGAGSGLTDIAALCMSGWVISPTELRTLQGNGPTGPGAFILSCLLLFGCRNIVQTFECAHLSSFQSIIATPFRMSGWLIAAAVSKTVDV